MYKATGHFTACLGETQMRAFFHLHICGLLEKQVCRPEGSHICSLKEACCRDNQEHMCLIHSLDLSRIYIPPHS